MSAPTSAPLRFYVDVGLGGLAIPALVLRLGHISLTKIDVFGARKVPDTEWISWAGREGVVVLTKDDAIRRRPLERQALAASGLRVFCLTNANLTKDQQVARFEARWPAILRKCEEPGPYVCGVYADRLQDLAF